MDYQKIILTGNVTADPERKQSKKGDVAYTHFSVAVGDREKRKVFFRVTAFGKLGENAAKYLTKGSQALVAGRVEVGETGRFGVVADEVVFGASAKKQLARTKGK